jgi:hypothetical protein
MLIEGMPMTSSGGPRRQRRILSAAVALMLAASLGTSAPAAFADDLEDQ